MKAINLETAANDLVTFLLNVEEETIKSSTVEELYNAWGYSLTAIRDMTLQNEKDVIPLLKIIEEYTSPARDREELKLIIGFH